MEVEAAFVPPPLEDHVVGGSDGLVGPRLVHPARAIAREKREELGSLHSS